VAPMPGGNLLVDAYRAVENKVSREGDVRRPLLEQFFERAGEVLEDGRSFLAVVNAPTGYGKTTLSLASALAAATRARYFSKVVHVLPLRSIVEDVAGKAARVLGGEAVGVKMMGVSWEVFHAFPLNVTTVDTFTFDLLRLNTKKLHRVRMGEEFGYDFLTQASLLNSLVVLDEAHYALEEEYMRDAFYMVLDFLLRVGVPVVVMTATLSKGYEELLRKLARERDVECLKYEPLAGDPFVESESGKSISLGFAPTAEALEKALGYRRVLVVANNPARATCIYGRLRGSRRNVLLLHGRMKPSHKREVLERVRKLEELGEPLVLVATQVVEAGVDASFDALVTDPAPAYSLIQRMGRVARRPGDREGAVLVAEDGPYSPYEEAKVSKTLRWLKERGRGFKPRVPSTYAELLAEVHGRRATEVLPSTARLSLIMARLHEPTSRSIEVLSAIESHMRRAPFLREFNLPVDVDGETVLLRPMEAYRMYQRGLLEVEGATGSVNADYFYSLAKRMALGGSVEIRFTGNYDPERGLAECAEEGEGA